MREIWEGSPSLFESTVFKTFVKLWELLKSCRPLPTAFFYSFLKMWSLNDAVQSSVSSAARRSTPDLGVFQQ